MTPQDVIAALAARLGPPNVGPHTAARPAGRRWDSERHMLSVDTLACHGHEVVHVEIVVFADDGEIRRSFAVDECGVCDHYAHTAATPDEAMAARVHFYRAPLAVIVECAARVLGAR